VPPEEGDLASVDGSMVAGADAVIHGAAIYEIGVSAERARTMAATNVGGTARVHVPTAPATSTYEDTKRRAHDIALAAIRARAPVIVVQPGQVYGPGDHSSIGRSLTALAHGRLRYRAFGTLGLSFVHVDDVADGVVRAVDRGRAGESYVLGGEIARLDDAYRAVADVTGRPVPSLEIPPVLLRAAARLVPSLREVVASADGVTFWASDAKARRELGTDPRALVVGMRDTYGAAS
jgi:nucleoside-diphosphate-sugar epimerase